MPNPQGWERISTMPENAVQIHFGSVESHLKLVLEEELEHVSDRLAWMRADWTSAKYGDAVSKEEFDALWEQLFTRYFREAQWPKD